MMKKSNSIYLIKGMISGQKISSDKKELSRQFRKAMTKAEKVLWEKIRAKRLGGIHFRRQQVIGGIIVDFYCHEFGLVIEVDGSVHHEQKDYDLGRDRFLRERGLKVIRFTNGQILLELDAVLNEILNSCDLDKPE